MLGSKFSRSYDPHEIFPSFLYLNYVCLEEPARNVHPEGDTELLGRGRP